MRSPRGHSAAPAYHTINRGKGGSVALYKDADHLDFLGLTMKYFSNSRLQCFMETFFKGGPACQAYEAVRDYAHLADVKAFIEHLWLEFGPPGDPHFLEDAKAHFHERTWELYLWFVLKHQGFAPQKFGSIGPDFYFMSGEERIWIEAIAPGRGNGPDAVPPIRTINEMLEAEEEPVAETVPEEAILLRFTQAVQDKLRKYQEYRSKNIVQSKDKFIIAINGCMATDYRGDPLVPYVIKATIALGHLQVSFDPSGRDPSRSSYQRRIEVLKKNQKPVSTTLFLREEYGEISALLYSPKDICNVPNPIGSEMYYFHNPLTVNPIPRGVFRFCREYWADLERGELEHQDWYRE